MCILTFLSLCELRATQCCSVATSELQPECSPLAQGQVHNGRVASASSPINLALYLASCSHDANLASSGRVSLVDHQQLAEGARS